MTSFTSIDNGAEAQLRVFSEGYDDQHVFTY